MLELVKALRALRGLTLYEKYVIIMLIGIWMDKYLKTQEDIDWVEKQIKLMEETSRFDNCTQLDSPPLPFPLPSLEMKFEGPN